MVLPKNARPLKNHKTTQQTQLQSCHVISWNTRNLFAVRAILDLDLDLDLDFLLEIYFKLASKLIYV